MDPDLLDQEIKVCAKRGKLPKAVVPTDLYGQCADLESLLEVCKPYGIPVISDAAESPSTKLRVCDREQRAIICIESGGGASGGRPIQPWTVSSFRDSYDGGRFG